MTSCEVNLQPIITP